MNSKLLERLVGAHQALKRGATEDAALLILSAIELVAEQQSNNEYITARLVTDVPFFLQNQAADS